MFYVVRADITWWYRWYLWPCVRLHVTNKNSTETDLLINNQLETVFFPNLVLVAKTRNLDYITFNWNKVTASEYERQWKENKMSQKADFIHMIEVNVDHIQHCVAVLTF